MLNACYLLALLFSTDLPSEGPRIDGARDMYGIGEPVLINCTSAPSRPAASLTWYINGEQVGLLPFPTLPGSRDLRLRQAERRSSEQGAMDGRWLRLNHLPQAEWPYIAPLADERPRPPSTEWLGSPCVSGAASQADPADRALHIPGSPSVLH